ncbi:DExH-box ATP-dependent RNA helicase DExH7 [Cucumis melo var. makuwa]|uniref:RNA helicase n=1 Tax=Cucumis melo var. makuwa TaxID=1194695 RepID=A0A5D3CIT8_CUCMM|nr:DExH-box ATP-dependent RNA helicase DExH7 [Cucumis melo var. makuwa]
MIYSLLHHHQVRVKRRMTISLYMRLPPPHRHLLHLPQQDCTSFLPIDFLSSLSTTSIASFELMFSTHAFFIMQSWDRVMIFPLLFEKVNLDGTVPRLKACLVAKAYVQIYGTDYSDSFSPVAKLTFFRPFLSMEDVYIEQPPGFIPQEERYKVSCLRESLYGLKQSPHAWFGKFSQAFVRFGVKKSTSDHSAFYQQSDNDETVADIRAAVAAAVNARISAAIAPRTLSGTSGPTRLTQKMSAKPSLPPLSSSAAYNAPYAQLHIAALEATLGATSKTLGHGLHTPLLMHFENAGDETLTGITHIIVDEVHERSLLGDFLLVVLKNLIEKRSAESSSPLKVILMSATVDSNLFSGYFGNCPVITAEGRVHPVTTYFLEDIYESTGYHLASDSPAAIRYEVSSGKKVSGTRFLLY